MADATPPAAPDVKPGYKTTEFWLSAAATVAGIVLASGVVPSAGPWGQVAGIVCALLAATGHSVSRTIVKAAS